LHCETAFIQRHVLYSPVLAGCQIFACIIHVTACILSVIDENISFVVIVILVYYYYLYYFCLLFIIIILFHVVLLPQYTTNWCIVLRFLISTRNNGMVQGKICHGKLPKMTV